MGPIRLQLPVPHPLSPTSPIFLMIWGFSHHLCPVFPSFLCLICSGFGCSRQQKRHAAAPPPARVRRRMEGNRQKLVGQDKGSLTEQQTKGTRTGTTTIQKTGIYERNPQNRTALSDRTTAVPSRATSEFPPQSSPPPEPSMTAQGMEYPALFGQVGVGSAPPAVPLPGVR